MILICRQSENKQLHNSSTVRPPVTNQQPEMDNETTIVDHVVQKEAKLKRLNEENRQLQKKSHHIKRSRTWKLAWPLRKARRLFRRSNNVVDENKRLKEQMETTAKELYTTQKRLKETEEENLYLKLEAKENMDKEVQQSIKQTKDNGDIIPYLKRLVERKQSIDTNYNVMLRKIGRQYNQEKADVKRIVFTELLKGLNIEDIPEFIVRFAESKATLSLKEAASFRACLTIQARRRQWRKNTPEQTLDDKLHAYTLMDELKVRRPWIKEKNYPLSEIPKEEGIVIKPLAGAGSRGVYLVFDSNHIQDVKRGRMLQSFEAVKTSMEEDIASHWVTQDKWIVEELILQDKASHLPATDLKFYCFYGKVALILEITRFPVVSYCWWTPNGERISTGKYEQALFKGEGVTKEEIETASFISKALPIPFIRIDFLKTQEELVFGEFTPTPGNYDEFDKKTDQWLGDYYIDAEGRLVEDLIEGKSFPLFKQ